MLRRLISLLAIGCAMMGGARGVDGQTPPGSSAAKPSTVAFAPSVPVASLQHPDSVAAMIPYARTYVALNTLRERADAEYAEPKNKIPEALMALREKYRVERDALLKSHGFSDASYARFTQRVSGDDAARLAFEAALAKITAKK